MTLSQPWAPRGPCSPILPPPPPVQKAAASAAAAAAAAAAASHTLRERERGADAKPLRLLCPEPAGAGA